MPQLELSLIEGASRATSPPDQVPTPRAAGAARPVPPIQHPPALARWAATVSGADEACLVLAVDSAIVACSTSCAEMVGLGDVAAAVGRQLREAVDLVDFTDSLDRLDRAETDKIPPLLAISSGRLARGLMRVAGRTSKTTCTMDAIATPLYDGATVTGSLTFFSRI